MTDASAPDVQELSHEITQALARVFNPALPSTQRIFDNGVFAVFASRTCGIELRFSERNEKPQSGALITMALALAKLRGTPIELCDERPEQHIGASFTVHPAQTLAQVRALYDQSVQAYSGFSLMYHAQVDALVHALGQMPACRVEVDEG